MSEFKAEICLPKRLAEDVQDQVNAGWFPDLNSLVVEAVRRYLETHRGELKEQFIRQDVNLGTLWRRLKNGRLTSLRLL